MATDTSQGEFVHPKALPLIVGAQLIHADKLGEVGADTFLKLTLGSVPDFRPCWVLLGTCLFPYFGEFWVVNLKKSNRYKILFIFLFPLNALENHQPSKFIPNQVKYLFPFQILAKIKYFEKYFLKNCILLQKNLLKVICIRSWSRLEEFSYIF